MSVVFCSVCGRNGNSQGHTWPGLPGLDRQAQEACTAVSTVTGASPELTTHDGSSPKPITLINSKIIGGYLQNCFSKVVGAKSRLRVAEGKLERGSGGNIYRLLEFLESGSSLVDARGWWGW